jgi:hypothetical protein
MKKIFIVSIIIILAAAAVMISIRFLSGDEDIWICDNGEWVKHGNPSAPKPFAECETSTESLVKVEFPKSGDVVASPLEIKGEARGFWFFEASFPVFLVGSDEKVIAQGIATAKSDPEGAGWMTENFVPFEAKLEFEAPAVSEGFLVLKKDNPSGLPENDDEVKISVQFETFGETRTVKVFFGNSNLDPEFSCNKVFAVERRVVKTPAIARAALEELLKGATEADKADGFFTSINDDVVIQSLVISNGTARVDFSDKLEYQVGGSCRVAAIRAQIVETLKQFGTVQDVIISINGRAEDILQP